MLFSEYGDLLSLNDVCDILEVKPATVSKLCRTGKLKAFKAGREWRVTRLALESYIFSESHFPMP